MAAQIANRLAGTYTLMGDGARALAFGRQALEGGRLDAAVASQTRTLIAMGASLVSGPHAGRPSWPIWKPTRRRCGGSTWTACPTGECSGCWLATGPGYQRPGRQPRAGAPGRDAHPGRACLFLAGHGPVPGRRWDDVLLTAEQGFSAAAIHARRFELPLLHLSAGCVPAGRGAAAGGRAARGAGRTGRGQRGLQPGTGVRRHGPGPGLPGGRRLPGHGRRARSLAGRAVLDGRSR